MAKQNWGEILKYGTILAGGFMAVYVAKKIHDGLPTGEAIKSAAKAAVDAVNPASDKNLAYRAVNAVTGNSSEGADANSIGTRFRGWVEKVTHSDPMEIMAKRDAAAAAARVSSVTTQGADASQSMFRTAEITAENAPAPDAQSSFRLSELTYDGSGASANFGISDPTSWD